MKYNNHSVTVQNWYIDTKTVVIKYDDLPGKREVNIVNLTPENENEIKMIQRYTDTIIDVSPAIEDMQALQHAAYKEMELSYRKMIEDSLPSFAELWSFEQIEYPVLVLSNKYHVTGFYSGYIPFTVTYRYDTSENKICFVSVKLTMQTFRQLDEDGEIYDALPEIRYILDNAFDDIPLDIVKNS